jgi:hypothetical protein
MSRARYKSRSRAEAKAKATAKPPETLLDRFGLLIIGVAILAFIAGGLYFLAYREIDPSATAYDRAIVDCVKDRTRVVDTAGAAQGDPTSDCVRDTPIGKSNDQ